MRGKDRAQHVHRHVKGITPACAGKSNSGQAVSAFSGDHPRVCGEKPKVRCSRLSRSGSPPRVRGKDDHRLQRVIRDGITPACAGKSACGCTSRCRCWDHPRVCGEKAGTTNAEAEKIGSPPRVRGKDKRPDFELILDRITPACAGKSCDDGGHRDVLRDHPRVCGEKSAGLRCPAWMLGLPPRVRGKVQ